jgi:hypothetical protein
MNRATIPEVNAQEVLTAMIAAGGFIGTIALLVLNLSLRANMGEMRSEMAVDLGKMQVQMADLRAESASDRATAYEKIMDNMSRLYISREAQQAMHDSNVRILQDMRHEIQSLSQRVTDIG